MDDIEKMLIERACARLNAEYCQLTDLARSLGAQEQAQKIADLFVEDGVLKSPMNEVVGRAAIKELLEKVFASAHPSQGGRHTTSNMLVDVIDRDHAKAVTYVVVYAKFEKDQDVEDAGAASPFDAKFEPLVVGEYYDDIRRTADGWKYRCREWRLG